MSVKSNTAFNNAAMVGFPAVGGNPQIQKQTETEKPKKKKISAEKSEKSDKAERAKEDDARAGDTRRSEQGGQQTRVVRRVVRRHRVTNTQQAKPTYGSSPAELAQQAKETKKQAKAEQKAANAPSTTHMMRKMNSQSSLNQMTANFQSAQAGRPSGPQTPVGQKMSLISNLGNYMKNDYACMKANEQDTAFTYKTSEARQLCATFGTMLSSAVKQNTSDKDKKSTSSSSGDRTLSPAAYSRQKGLLRELKAMSDPMCELPEGLPPDYKPFELTA